ncbi:Right origin-binding protein [Bacillus thermotolerans]|nr:Right origin-binding protein [Bacillus thermotolerans]
MAAFSYKIAKKVKNSFSSSFMILLKGGLTMNDPSFLQSTLEFIEEHLTEKLPLSRLAGHAGFSAYHFHRVFQKEAGMTAADYIRSRRLALASALLLYSEESIMDIALELHFSSQESFTRAFKKVYRLPPGKYRKLMTNMLTNEGGDLMTNQQTNGWFLSGSHPFHYEMGTDTKVVHQGRCSGYLKSKTVQDEGTFATMMQQFKSEKYKGKRVKLSAFLKTENAAHFAGMWMRVDDAAGDMLQFDNMSNRPLSGTMNWNKHSIVLDVPQHSAAISFGVLLSGQGQIWADGFAFEEVDQTVPVTHLETEGVLNDEPVNLSFEEGLSL